MRAEVIRRRLAYEADPAGFVSRYAAEEAELAVRIADARQLLARVVLPDAELRRIATLCAAFDVDGMRADLVVARAAIAHAAWRGAETVSEPDIRVAAELALPHRRRRDPFDEPGLDPDQLDQAMRDSAPPQDQDGEDPDPDPDGPGGGAPESAPDPAKASDSQQDSASAAGSSRPSPAPSATFRTKTLRVPGVGMGAPGKRSVARNRAGKVIAPSSDEGFGVHVIGTLMSAASRVTEPGRLPRPVLTDLQWAIREGREGNLVIFVVDASGSMAARQKMSAVSGATLSLLRDAYQRRDKVAVITFRGQDAAMLLAPTGSTHIAGRAAPRPSVSPISEWQRSWHCHIGAAGIRSMNRVWIQISSTRRCATARRRRIRMGKILTPTRTARAVVHPSLPRILRKRVIHSRIRHPRLGRRGPVRRLRRPFVPRLCGFRELVWEPRGSAPRPATAPAR
ncbi:Possible magnesium-chelatase [Mycobacteroides abscessus subsp. abscessus]|nr:Possible magnesium-chelatase [Mycobacteroides abscessus subsp. abscessus]